MTGILGKKVGMTQIFAENGGVIPVTVIQSGPCPILQIKTEQRDGYNAIQLGFEEIKPVRKKKPQRALFQKHKITPRRFIRELRINDPQPYKVGQDITLDGLSPGDYVEVAALSKGKGFQGGMRRWGWSGGPASHGSMSHRAPGSIGASAYPSRVLKGHHLPGHMGRARVTVQGLQVVKIDREHQVIIIKGSVPGAKNSILMIKKSERKKPKPVGQKPTAGPKAVKQPKQGKSPQKS